MTHADGDLDGDGDGDVDIADLAELLGHFGTTCRGACCVWTGDMYECLNTSTQPECDALGGEFYLGEDCFGDPPFECPPYVTIEILVDLHATAWMNHSARESAS